MAVAWAAACRALVRAGKTVKVPSGCTSQKGAVLFTRVFRHLLREIGALAVHVHEPDRVGVSQHSVVEAFCRPVEGAFSH